MRVLIIEDADFMAKSIKDALEARGHEVDWVIGVSRLSPLVGMTESKENIDIDPTDYDVVLCDGQLPGENQGPAIVRTLAQLGVTCFGISSEPGINTDMLECGAVGGAVKIYFFAAIVEDVLTMEIVQQRQQVSDAIAAIDALSERVQNDKPLRSKLEDLIRKHMQLG